MTIRCSGCGITVENGARSLDKAHENITKDGWVTWLPHKKVMCPTCGTPYLAPRTV